MLVKLHFRFPEIAFGLLLAVAIFATGMTFESSRSPPAGSQSQQRSNDRGPEITANYVPDKITDWLLVGLNLFIVVSTFMLWRANNRSAKIAERVLTELEVPIIGVKIIKTGIEWDFAKTKITTDILQYSFVNYGRTPATLYELIDDVRSAKVGEGFPPHIKAQRGPQMPYGVFIPPNGGETRPFTFNIFAHILGIAATINPSALKANTPFFMGTARYGDIFGNLYTMGFCFMFDDVSNRFIESGDTNYSYCRKERGPYKPTGTNNDSPLAAG